MYSLISDRIKRCKERIEAALYRANRSDSVTIIGATKTKSKELVDYLADTRLLLDVGENKVQEITAKYDPTKKINWHMIGQLQSNKVKYLVDKVVLIHSLDRLSLAEEINRQALKRNVICNCLVEINSGAEITKGGIEINDLFNFLDMLQKYDNIEVLGLMSVLPNLNEKKMLIDLYKSLADVYEQMKNKKYANTNAIYMSTGMSGDYELAVEYGNSNMVRLGRVLFGERDYGGLK